MFYFRVTPCLPPLACNSRPDGKIVRSPFQVAPSVLFIDPTEGSYRGVELLSIALSNFVNVEDGEVVKMTITGADGKPVSSPCSRS